MLRERGGVLRAHQVHKNGIALVQRRVCLPEQRHVQVTAGPGVVGVQPVLNPSQAFEYTSFCPLKTPYGSMRGTYQMVSQEGVEFDAEIAAFALNEPYSIN